MPYATRDTGIEDRLTRAGFRLDQTLDGTHASTLRMALTSTSDEELFAGSERKKLHYEMKHAERSGATVRTGTRKDMSILRQLDDALIASQRKRAKSAAWFDAMGAYLEHDSKRGALFIADHDGRSLAAMLVLRHGKRATYVAGASIPAARPFSKMALPLANAIRWARAQGCEEFDFGGIPAAGDTDDKRVRIAQFKFDFTKQRIDVVRRHTRWL